MKEPQDRNASPNDQAAEWFVRLRDGDLTAAERRRYVRWLKHSPSHISQFLQLAHLYKGLKIAELPMPAPELKQSSNVVELVPRVDDAPPAAGVDAERQGPPLRVRIAAAIAWCRR